MISGKKQNVLNIISFALSAIALLFIIVASCVQFTKYKLKQTASDIFNLAKNSVV